MDDVAYKRVVESTLLVIRDDWTLLATHESGNLELEQAWLKGAQRLYHLFCRKNRDYGDKNLALGYLTGIVVRLSDKLGRQWNLLMRGRAAAVEDEKLVDTFDDAANYNIVAGLMLRGEWKRYSIEDVLPNSDSPVALEQLLGEALPDMSDDLKARLVEVAALYNAAKEGIVSST